MTQQGVKDRQVAACLPPGQRPLGAPKGTLCLRSNTALVDFAKVVPIGARSWGYVHTLKHVQPRTCGSGCLGPSMPELHILRTESSATALGGPVWVTQASGVMSRAVNSWWLPARCSRKEAVSRTPPSEPTATRPTLVPELLSFATQAPILHCGTRARAIASPAACSPSPTSAAPAAT